MWLCIHGSIKSSQKTKEITAVFAAMRPNIIIKDIITVSHHLWTCPRRDTSWSGSAGTGFGSCAWWDTFHSWHTSYSGCSAECCVWRNPVEGTRTIRTLNGVFCGTVLYIATTKTWRNTSFIQSHLAAFTGVHAVMEPGCDVPTHLTQKHHTSGLCEKGIRPSSGREIWWQSANG